MSPASIGVSCAVLGALGFSFKAIFIKLAYRYGVDAETLLALRMSYALPFFAAMAVMAHRRDAIRLSGSDWRTLMVLGFLGYYLASYLDFLGLQYISAGLERLILFMYPTLVLVLSAVFLAKPITRRAVWPLLLCYAGIGLVFVHDMRETAASTTVAWGSALVFASALSYSAYLMISGQVVRRLGSTRVTAYATGFACLLSIAQFLAMRPLGALVQVPQVHAISIAMAVFSTVLPIWLVSEAIRRMGAGPASMTGTLGPVFTLLLAVVFLGEPIGAVQMIGAGLVIVGVSRVSKV